MFYIFIGHIHLLNINYYSLANYIPSLIYMLIIVQISFIHTAINKINFDKKMQIYSISIILMIAELLQRFTNIGTFDLVDIIYIIIGISIANFIEKIFTMFNKD